MKTTTLVQCVLATAVLLLPLSAARVSPRGARYGIERRAMGWTYAGCYNDTVGARALTTNPQTPGGVANLTIEICESTCFGLGFIYSGSEYAGECYCGNEFSNYGALAVDGEIGCSMPCNGNASEICGGSYRLSVYKYGTLVVSSSSASSSSTASSSLSSSSPSSSSSSASSSALSSSVLTTSSTKSSTSSSSSKLTSVSSSSKSSSSSSVAPTSTSKIVSSSSSSTSKSPSVSPSKSSLSSTSSSVAVSSPKSSSSSTKPVSSSSTQSSSSIVSTTAPGSSSTSATSTLIVSSPAPLASGWSSLGCYTDGVGSRALINQYWGLPGAAVTIEGCQAACLAQGATYAGLEYADECYCGITISNGNTIATDGGCNMACTGSATENCGGSNRINIYTYGVGVATTSSTLGTSSLSSSSSFKSTTAIATSSPKSSSTSTSASTSASPSVIPGWAPIGCYTDSVGLRTFSTEIYTTPGPAMTVELCLASCKAASFVLAGLEYAGECYCGNTIPTTSSLVTDGCTMACNGNATEICGGSNRLSVYSFGVVSSSSSSTVTSTSASGTSSSVSKTLSSGSKSSSSGSKTSSVVSVTSSSTSKSTSTVSKPTSSSSTSSGLKSVSKSSSVISSSTSVAPKTSSSSSSAVVVVTSTTSTIAVSTGVPTGWTYKGCWLDQAFGRILSTQVPDSATLTVESCTQTCSSMGYTIAGMEYFTQCYCGNAMINQATLAAEADCNTACGGNAAEICGGGNRMSIYSSQTTLTVKPVPKVQTTGLPGSWTYMGCLIDDAIIRTFPYQIEFLNNNTATNCLTQCAQFGYGAAGMEYGEQCFCGDVQNIIDAGATLQDASGCNMLCTGNDSYLCGGPNRISYYQWTGAALNSWDFKTGIAAGEYDFLIGNVIIPLIATPGVNGKVTFLEKWGTEPANNSTGAYELDLNLLNNFTAAWRPMHVKTDVFCSAGITLPDKVGRQLNVGGWANDATYGVRLYWPDGTPGVWGVNDWQENVSEVHLQIGRWYPTAMTMANGSILVVGGEQGSNGAPVPSLEVLPLPAGSGTLYCDWLDRTDPYNLYPYLAVLPSGGIVSLYYNEARILDEVSLGTQRVLPNMPGAVNDFLGGRTYPFEGTSMLFPQHAPYTDPLTIIVCGGSIPGPEFALDNCVSIQPEVAGANWTIERMPSKRVISCITALPDGTYLINNGAQQGRAGFGLATQPNLNAILYDPSKPVNHRMSVMANTTVARLYHSESVLLQDGRVLITGSDPEDLRFPQEYRVEVFMPPYLLSGLTKPTYTLSKTDIAYGETFTVTVNLHQGTTSTMRISLLAAVSSTHGNSMGQRTIFPAFTCVGNVCTVTAPPNAHVSPPAWHMLFVLDGPTPSNAQWVRIGGDPAGLGNWPNFPDFKVPGI